MGQDARTTVEEIEFTREELARKVDELIDQARVEAAALTKKVAIVAAAIAGLLIIGAIAKARVGD